jgi:threonyl-tRNA synthetase
LKVDLNLPGRLGASFVDKDGTKKVPVMLHRALFGSLERFIGILIEHYAGKLPFWMSPTQAIVLPISDENNKYAKKVFEDLFKEGIKCEVDLKNQKINYKIREYSLAKVPYLLICGKKEEQDNTITIRKLGSEKQETIKINQLIKNMNSLNKLPLN